MYRWYNSLLMDSSSIIENLKSKGHKNTKVRQALVEILLTTHSPLSIIQLLQNLSKKGLKPNKTTVYREIEFLTNQGLVSGVDFGEGKKRYEGSGDHHHHIVCINCKSIKDISEDVDLDKLHASVVKKVGYKPVGHSLEFFGLCSNCQ